MGAAASSSSSAASSAGTAVLLASTRSVAGVGGGARWAAVTDGTARGGDTVLSIVEDAAVATGAFGWFRFDVPMCGVQMSIFNPIDRPLLHAQGARSACKGRWGRWRGKAAGSWALPSQIAAPSTPPLLDRAWGHKVRWVDGEIESVCASTDLDLSAHVASHALIYPPHRAPPLLSARPPRRTLPAAPLEQGARPAGELRGTAAQNSTGT